jgi:hypothetical protein
MFFEHPALSDVNRREPCPIRMRADVEFGLTVGHP